MMVGRAPAGAKSKVAGRFVRLTLDGRFVIGFGRDHGPTASLEVHHAGGGVEKKTLKVVKRDYQIQRIDGLPPKMVSPPESVWTRIKQENRQIGRARAVDSETPYFLEGFIWPSTGRISGVYGSQRVLNGEPKRPHYGIDIAAPRGAPVVAPAGGVIRLAHQDMYYTGKTIILDHGHGVSSAFLHMDSLTVREGDVVARGQQIGTVGSTGRSTGPHLDWRINLFKTRIDPQTVVGPMPE